MEDTKISPTKIENLENYRVISEGDSHDFNDKFSTLEDLSNHKKYYSITLNLPETTKNIESFCDRFIKLATHPSLEKVRFYTIDSKPTFLWEIEEEKTLEFYLQNGKIDENHKNNVFLKILSGLAFLRERKITLSKFDYSIIHISDDLNPKLIGYGFHLSDEQSSFSKMKHFFDGFIDQENMNYEEAIFELLLKCQEENLSNWLNPLEIEQISPENKKIIEDAKKGDAEKCFSICILHKNGKSSQFPQSERLSHKFLKLSAEFGKKEAQFEYANLLLKKDSPNNDEILQFLKKAADNEHIQAAFQLYKMTDNLDYLKKAADGNHKVATKLYASYLFENIFQQNQNQLNEEFNILTTLKYLRQNYNLGDTSLIFELGATIFENAKNFMKLDNNEENKESEENNKVYEMFQEAEKFLIEAAKKEDNLNAVLKLIELYKIMNRDYTNLLRAAADLGDTSSMYLYAKSLSENYENVERDILKYYSMAVDNGLNEFLPDLLNVARSSSNKPSLYLKCEPYFEKVLELETSNEEEKKKASIDLAIISYAKNKNNKVEEYLEKGKGANNYLVNFGMYSNDENILKEIADEGDSLAMFLYGMKTKSIEYIEKSASEKCPFALNLLGLKKIEEHEEDLSQKEKTKKENDREEEEEEEGDDNAQSLLTEAAILTKPKIKEMLPFPSIIFFDKQFRKLYLSNIKKAADLQNPHSSYLYAFMTYNLKERAFYYKKAGDLGIKDGYLHYSKLVKKDNELLTSDSFDEIPIDSFGNEFNAFVSFQEAIFNVTNETAPVLAQNLASTAAEVKSIYKLVHNIMLAVDYRPLNLLPLANMATSLHFLIGDDEPILQNRFRDLLIEECCSNLSRNRSRFMFIELCIENFMFTIEYFTRAVNFMRKNSNNFNKYVELWFPEVRPHRKLDLDYYYSKSDKKAKDNTLISDEYIIKNRKNGNPNKLTIALRTDNLLELKRIMIENKKVTVNTKIEPSFFELSSMMDRRPSLISYAAFYGAEKCFCYLMENAADAAVFDDECLTVSAYAAASGELSVLAKLEEDGDLDYQVAAEYAAIFHRKELLDSLVEGRPITSLIMKLRNQKEKQATPQSENKQENSTGNKLDNKVEKKPETKENLDGDKKKIEPKLDTTKIEKSPEFGIPEKKLNFFDMVADLERERLASASMKENTQRSSGIAALMSELSFPKPPEEEQNNKNEQEKEEEFETKIDDLHKVIVAGILSDFVYSIKLFNHPKDKIEDNHINVQQNEENLDNDKLPPFNDEDEDEKSVFYELCERGNTGVLRFMTRKLWKSMLIEAITGGGQETILTRLAALGNFDTLDEILKMKEIRKLLRIDNYYGESPLEIAAKHEKQEIVDLIESYLE
ncbi:hypothetical protein TRFO_21541 [Tritrichomonas foetus]|uniref:DUF3447 domain-containing protein n=1 Tax=Tritrichomonas foetus TaxID=1144522 RepID=A0A1J4KIB9_9EUKA|nr:hypothetical protein TRFO_21541 [Tritrichomonas foetus]|eukprot:OHT09572.1 hypothetical protein TRFO_21541 [Tritrichomonas foetus]